MMNTSETHDDICMLQLLKKIPSWFKDGIVFHG